MDIEKVYFAASDITEVYLSPDGEVETVYLSNSDIIEVIFAEHAGDPLTGAVKTVNDTPPNAAGNVDVTFSTIRGYPEVRKATDYLNAQGEFKPISIGGASSASIYMSNEDSAVVGYKKLNYTPDAAETIKTITANNNTVVGEAYLMDDPLNTTIFDAGTWFFNYFRGVSSAAQESFKGLDVFVRHANGTETLLFSLESASIEDTVLTERQVTYTQQAFSVALTDRLGVRSKFRTTRNAATVLSYVVGGARGWGMRTPLAIDHDNTRNKNANPDFQHITLAEKTQGALATGNATLYTIKKVADRVVTDSQVIQEFITSEATNGFDIVTDKSGNSLNLAYGTYILNYLAPNGGTGSSFGTFIAFNNITTGQNFRQNADGGNKFPGLIVTRQDRQYVMYQIIFTLLPNGRLISWYDGTSVANDADAAPADARFKAISLISYGAAITKISMLPVPGLTVNAGAVVQLLKVK